jgi:hypothetical protein
MITRSRALIDNMGDNSESSDEEGDAAMMMEEIMKSDPNNFDEAYFHRDENKRKGWRCAIMKELENMEKCNVWTVMNLEDIPKGRKLVGN